MKKSVKTILSLALTLSLAIAAAGCSSTASNAGSSSDNSKDKEIVIGVSPEPHEPIVENAIKPLLEKDGYTVKLVEFTDYNLPNKALAEGEIDANYFQHVPFLEKAIADCGYKLTYTAKVHLEPMGVYSNKYKSLDELPEGAEIAIPNDASNGARALKILADNGVIKVADGELISSKDITENKKNFKITEVDAEQLPRVLGEVAAAVINTNYALEANLNPLDDAIAIESSDSPYANIIAVREEDKDSDKIKALTKAATSEEVKKYIEDTYKGAILPAF